MVFSCGFSPGSVSPCALGAGIGVWQFEGGARRRRRHPVAKAVRGDIVVSVGGVGRVVQATPSAQIVVPTAGAASAGSGSAASTGPTGSGGSTSGGGATAPADAVFSRVSGRVMRFVVAPGQHVVAGQALAFLDDGGSAGATIKQARNDVSTALLEMVQKQTSDPLKGFPATPAELAAGRLGLTSAFAGLERLLGPPRPADVSAARLDVKRAQADLETLLGGRSVARAEAIHLAKLRRSARARPTRPPPRPGRPRWQVSAARAEAKKAEADLATLLQAPGSSVGRADHRSTAGGDRHAAEARGRTGVRHAGRDRCSPGSSLDQALADLAALLRPPPAPLPEEVDAARQAVDAARSKLAKLLGPPNAADVRSARLELGRAQADLRTLRAGPSPAALAAARQAVQAFQARLKELLGPPLRSDEALARLEVRKAEADLGGRRARGGPATPIEVNLAQLKVAAARERLASARLAKRLLTVRAPAAGTVTALSTVPGAPVDSSTPTVAVDDLDHLAVTVGLSEFDAAPVKKGMSAIVRVDALGGKAFKGTVLFAALTGVDSSGVVTFPVLVGLASSAGLKPGMNVSVRIIVAQRPNVVELPLEAVSRDGDESTVTVITASGEESPREVTLGLANNKMVEIVKGLRVGEQVGSRRGRGGR